MRLAGHGDQQPQTFASGPARTPQAAALHRIRHQRAGARPDRTNPPTPTLGGISGNCTRSATGRHRGGSSIIRSLFESRTASRATALACAPCATDGGAGRVESPSMSGQIRPVSSKRRYDPKAKIDTTHTPRAKLLGCQTALIIAAAARRCVREVTALRICSAGARVPPCRGVLDGRNPFSVTLPSAAICGRADSCLRFGGMLIRSGNGASIQMSWSGSMPCEGARRLHSPRCMTGDAAPAAKPDGGSRSTTQRASRQPDAGASGGVRKRFENKMAHRLPFWSDPRRTARGRILVEDITRSFFEAHAYRLQAATYLRRVSGPLASAFPPPRRATARRCTGGCDLRDGFHVHPPPNGDRDAAPHSLVTIVFNDGAYGNVRRIQRSVSGNRLIASDLPIRFRRFGKSFGAEAVRAVGPEGLRRALRRASPRDGLR